LEYDACIVIFSKFLDMIPRVRSIWRYEKAIGYIKNQFFLEFFEKDVSTTYKVKF
jgi:hypothetical protein